VNDGRKLCPHGRTATTVAAPDHGPGWLRDLAPDTCPLCKAGQVLSTYRPGSVQAEPEELEAQGVEAQGEELTAAPEGVEEPDPLAGLGTLELLARRIEELERWEKLAAGKAETLEVQAELGRKAAANAGRLVEAFSRVAELERFGAKASAIEKLAARMVKLEQLPELADNLADAVAALEGAEENAAGKAETLAAIDAVAKRVGELRANERQQVKVVRSWSVKVRALEEVALEHRAGLDKLIGCGPPGEAAILRRLEALETNRRGARELRESEDVKALKQRVSELESNLERQARLKGETIADLRAEVKAIAGELGEDRKRQRDIANVVGVLVRSIWETATDALRSRGMSGDVHAQVMRLVAAPWPKLEPDAPSSSPTARGLTFTREELEAASQPGAAGLAAAASIIKRTPCEDLRSPTEAELTKAIADAYEATPPDHVTIFVSGSPVLQKMADLAREEKEREASGEGGPRAWFMPRPGEHRRRVIIESPYSGDVASNTAYARKAMADSLARGEAPLLSHLLYTQVLDDLDPDDRAAGMEAGWSWTPLAQAVAVYSDLGMTKGMQRGIDRAKAAGVRIERRWLSPMRDEYPATFAELEKPEESKPIPAPPAPPTGSSDAAAQCVALVTWAQALDDAALEVVASGGANASEWVRSAALEEQATRAAGVCPPDCATLCTCPHPHLNCKC